MRQELRSRLSTLMNDDPTVFYAMLMDSGIAEDILNYIDGEVLQADEEKYIERLLDSYE